MIQNGVVVSYGLAKNLTYGEDGKERKFISRIALLAAMLFAQSISAQKTQPASYFYDDLGRLVRVVDQNGCRTTG